MKAAWLKAGMVAAVVSLAGVCFGSATFNVHDRVGNGWHMYSTVTLDQDGTLSGTTRLKNCNNVRGFTGGVFVVALDANNEAVYTTPVYKYGIKSCFFKRKRERTVTWSNKIPDEYLGKVQKIAIMQMHTPTNRVWNWVYNNRELIIKHAKYVKEVIQKIKDKEFGPDDAFAIIEAHLN
jgi:hypothetical protein